MKKLVFVFCLFTGVQLCSCTRAVPNQITPLEKTGVNETITDGYTTTSARNKIGASSSIEHEKTIMRLDDYLRGLAGVNVFGSGANASITVRGVSSFQSSSNEPLFVINGMPMANYASTYSMINPAEIKRVTVLTDAASTGIYGSRASSGVIVITLKNAK